MDALFSMLKAGGSSFSQAAPAPKEKAPSGGFDKLLERASQMRERPDKPQVRIASLKPNVKAIAKPIEEGQNDASDEQSANGINAGDEEASDVELSEEETPFDDPNPSRALFVDFKKAASALKLPDDSLLQALVLEISRILGVDEKLAECAFGMVLDDYPKQAAIELTNAVEAIKAGNPLPPMPNLLEAVQQGAQQALVLEEAPEKLQPPVIEKPDEKPFTTSTLAQSAAEILNSRKPVDIPREDAAAGALPSAVDTGKAHAPIIVGDGAGEADQKQDGGEKDAFLAPPQQHPLTIPLSQKIEAFHVDEPGILPEPEIVSPADITRQIFGQIRARAIAPEISELKLTLRPESLGEVALSVKSDNGVIAAQFVAADPRVKEILESSLSQLRIALAGQGLDISQLSVSVGGEGNQSFEQQNRHRAFSYEPDDEEEEEKERNLFNSKMNLTV
jgi:flagellar hook-length control protein FliK